MVELIIPVDRLKWLGKQYRETVCAIERVNLKDIMGVYSCETNIDGILAKFSSIYRDSRYSDPAYKSPEKEGYSKMVDCCGCLSHSFNR